MAKRSSSSAPLIFAVLAIGLFARLLSLIWLYVVIGGALFLVGWIIVELSRRARVALSVPPLAPRAEPGPAPLPSGDPLRSLVPIERTVFDNPERTKAAALKTFEAWAHTLPLPPEHPSSLVRSVDIEAQYIGRLATTLAERKVVAREMVHRGSKPITGPRLAPSTIDPWAFTPESLRSDSLHVTACAPCDGTGRVPCPNCSGTMSVTCPGCNGNRKAYGYASNGSRRLMNCKQCLTKGEIACTTCNEGRVLCRSCGGSGRMEHWLEFVETRRDVVRVALDREQLRAFPWSAAGAQVSLADMEVDARRIGEVTAKGELDEAKAAEFAPRAWLQANWPALQPVAGPGERIQEQTLWILEVPRVQVSYALEAAPPTAIVLEGRRMLAPPASVDRWFEARAQRVLAARGAFLCMAFGVPLAYLFRGSYFWNAWVGALTLCVAGAAFAGARFVRESTLGRAGARRWAVAVIVTLILACGLAVGAEPSLRAARRYLSEGQLEEARAELDMLGAPDNKSHAQAWADLRLAHALASNDVATVATDATNIPKKFPQRATAEQRLQDLTQSTVTRQLSNKNLEAARETLAQAAPVLRDNARTEASGGQFAELSARVKDAEFTVCRTEPCRWKAAFEAARTSPSEARQQRLTATRDKLMEGLDIAPRPREAVLTRLHRLDAAAALAQALGDMPGDEDLSAQARVTAVRSMDERRKIPLVGAEQAVAAELLRIPLHASTSVLSTVTSSVAVHCWMKGGRCVGVYLVGHARGARELNDSVHAKAAEALLSQALGRPTHLPAAPSLVGGKAPSMSRWKDGGVTIVARWRESSLMELRIGDVEP